MKCLYCGREFKEEDAAYCPYCGVDLKAIKRRTGFPIAAGVLTIIASCICLIVTVPSLVGAAVYGWRFFSSFYAILLLVIGVLGVLAFALGLASGIFSFKRMRFGLTIAGESIVLASGVAGAFVGLSFSGIIFGLPVIILAILGIVFTAISKGEFK